jgi:hypothetical protein
MGNLNEKNYAKYDNPEEESRKDLDDGIENKYRNIPYGRSKSEQRNKKKMNTQSAKRSGSVKDKVEEGKGARKTGSTPFKKGNEGTAAKANAHLDDVRTENPEIKARKEEERNSWEDKPKKGKNSKPKGKRQSDKRRGMMSEQIEDLVNAVARDDYSGTRSMLQDIVNSKVEQRKQEEIQRIRGEQEND